MAPFKKLRLAQNFMEPILLATVCPKCHATVAATVNFCPRCGAKLKEPPISISFGRLAFVYLISFFLAPFGLVFAFKYLRQPDPKARTVGIVVIILTILAIALTILTANMFTRWEYQLINDLLK